MKDESGVVTMQKDDTLTVCGLEFAAKKNEKLRKAEFKPRENEELTANKPIDFNGCIICMFDNNILV